MKLNEIEKRVIREAMERFLKNISAYRNFMANGNVTDFEMAESYEANATNAEFYLMGIISAIAGIHEVIPYYFISELLEKGTMEIAFFDCENCQYIDSEIV